jgi:hypothetical protein
VLSYLQALDETDLNQLSEVSIVSSDHIVAYTVHAAQIRLGGADRLAEKAELTDSFLKDAKTAGKAVEFVDFSYKAPIIRLK